MSASNTEETPLLETQHDAIYNRFSPQKKRIIVAVISWIGMLPLFVSGSFIPSLRQIAHDLNTTGAVVSLAVSISIAAVAIGALCWAAYAGFYGRRAAYLASLPLAILGSLGVACATNIPWLMCCRFLQAFGTSGGISLGSAVIADIYKLEERGTAMGVFFGAILFGPALAPVAGGIAAQYSSWRIMQLALGIAALIAFSLVYGFLPETSQPNSLGLDILNKRLAEAGAPPRRFVFVNPLGALSLLASPNLLAVTLAGTSVLLTDYVLLVPVAYTIGVKYNIDNDALIGACILPCGLGNLIGAPFAGWLSDKIIIRARKQRDGVWYPEDRLRAALPGALIFAPVPVLAFGLIVDYMEGTIGLVLALICFFLNGLGVDLVLSPLSSYATDIFHSKSAEVTAASMGFRSLLLSIATMFILPLLDSIGTTATMAIAAGLTWLGFLALWATIVYGDQLRAWKDMGYSTAETN